MFHLDNSSGIHTMPTVQPKKSEIPLWFTSGGDKNPPSYPGVDWFNIVQAELLNLLTEAKITPNKDQFNQLAVAIKKMIADYAISHNGGVVNGEIVSTTMNAIRLKQTQKNISSIIRFDGDDLWFLFTNPNNPDGSFNELRPMGINAKTGDVRFSNNVSVKGKPVVKQGDYGLGANAISLTESPNFTTSSFIKIKAADLDLPELGSAELCGIQSTSRADDLAFQLFGTNNPQLAKRVFFRSYSKESGNSVLNEFITTENIQSYISQPAGMPQPYPATTPPAGWLKCNGAAFDKTRYPKLASVYPSGFLPDLRGEFIRGFDDDRGVDEGRVILTGQNQQIAAHKHVGGWGENIVNGGKAIFGSAITNKYYGSHSSDSDNRLFYTNDGTSDIDWPDINPNGLIGGENRPRNIAFLYIVKAE
ncbi:tail fiber protein [Orbaceae bacterium ESL0721]|nr:tail fiber protein [Orbaceae bacterium ESL0721]